MKIVDVAEFYSEQGGGVRTYVHQKLAASRAAGVDCTIIAPGAEDRVEAREGGRIVWVKSPAHPFDHRYHWFRFGGGAPAVHAAIDAERPDVVECSSPWQGAWITSKWRGDAATVFFLHQDPVAVYPQTFLGGAIGARAVDRLCGFFWAYLDRLSRRFDETVVSGEWLADRLAGFGLRRPKAVPFGVDGAAFSPRLADAQTRREMLAACGVRPEDADRATLAVAVSRHHPEKRIGTLFRAVEELSKERPIGLYLIGDGPSRRRVEKRAAETPGVFVAGQISDRGALARKMASADFMLHGGAAETFGLVVAEALSAGLPLVVPDLGGAADLARPSYAEIYTAGKPGSCAEAVRRLTARDPAALRAAVVRDALPRLRSPDDHFADLFRLYEGLAARRYARRPAPAPEPAFAPVRAALGAASVTPRPLARPTDDFAD